MRVMEEGPAPPAVGVNVNAIETPDLPATRPLAVRTLNVTAVTVSPIGPEAADTVTDTIVSALVCTVTELLPLEAPMVRPASVMVTAAPSASAVPPVVMMMDVAPGAPGDRVAPIVDSVALGVAVVAKKPEG